MHKYLYVRAEHFTNCHAERRLSFREAKVSRSRSIPTIITPLNATRIQATAESLLRNQLPAQSDSTPDIHRSQNHKNAPDAPAPLSPSPAQSPTLRPTE